MKRFVFAVAAAMAVVACAKEATPTQNQGVLGFSAVVEQQNGATKTTLEDGAQVVWTAGDEVCMYHWDNGMVTYAGFTAETAGTSTTFESNPAHDGGLAAVNTGDIAIYPFHEGNTLANTLTDDHTVTFTTSVDQTYVPNSFPAGANVAVGVVTEVGGKPFVNFRNVFGVLKLSLTGDKKIKSIRIADNDGKKLAGDFSVDMTNPSSPVFTQTGGSDYILLNCGEEGVQLNISTPTDFYIVVPTGAFEHGFTATVTPVETKYQTKDVATTAPNIINRSHVRVMPGKSVIFPESGLIDGVFTVDESNTKVRFSSGLLQAKYSEATTSYSFKIAESQLEYVGNAKGNTTIDNQKDGAIVDLFGWSTDNVNNPWGISASKADDDYTGTFVDWATLESLASYPTFKTPSSEWWTYIFKTRTCAFSVDGGDAENNRFALVKVNGVAGVLLFPDTFAWNTATMGDVPGTFNSFPAAQDWNNVNYTLDQFGAMEIEGVVFLPAAGERNGDFIYYHGHSLLYWSSTAYNATGAYHVVIGANYVGPVGNGSVHNGRCVRLVSVID